MPASEDTDAVAAFEDTPFEAIEYLRGKNAEIVAATRETAEAVVEKLATEGTLTHDAVAAPAVDIRRRRGRVMKLGRKPDLPLSAATFYWSCVCPTVRTDPAVRLNGWTIDPDLAPTGEALDDALATASLPEHQRDRFEGYVRGCLEYLQNNPHTPVTAHELHEHAPQIPASPENMGGHDRSLSVLAGLPGVSEPDDAPAWHYVGGADE